MLKDAKGQSTIELLTTIIFVFGFIFLFLKTALYTTNHFMAQYYTYLASRTYMVMDNNSNQLDGPEVYAETKARALMSSFPLDLLNIDGELNFNAPSGSSHKLLVGAYYEFSGKMTLGNSFGGDQEMDLISESFLLREPSRINCLKRICDAFAALGVTNCDRHITLADNGC